MSIFLQSWDEAVRLDTKLQIFNFVDPNVKFSQLSGPRFQGRCGREVGEAGQRYIEIPIPHTLRDVCENGCGARREKG